MGEMADFALDGISFEAEFESEEDITLKTSEKSCKYCGAGGLSWAKAGDESKNSSWRLVDSDGNLHSCKAFKMEEGK